jgi:hypothetical protein
MSELQPGMLALVIRSSMMPESVGTIVTCDERVFINEYGEFDDSGVVSWMVSGNDYIPDGAGCYERNLLPLPPLSDPLDVTRKEELHA